MLPPSCRMYFPIDLPRPVPPPVIMMVLSFIAPGCSMASVYVIAKGFCSELNFEANTEEIFIFSNTLCFYECRKLPPFADEPICSQASLWHACYRCRARLHGRYLRPVAVWDRQNPKP